MIRSRKELKFFIMADMMMNRGKFRWTVTDRIKHLILPDKIMQYLVAMRKAAYYSDIQLFTPPRFRVFAKILKAWYFRRYHNLGLKLGFSIGRDTLGYGAVIPHYGTIVVGGRNRLGNYTVLHTSTCITDNGITIGNALSLSTGSIITKQISLGDNVTVAANSLVNQSFPNNCLLAGTPAGVKRKENKPWYEQAGQQYIRRVQAVEALKQKLGL